MNTPREYSYNMSRGLLFGCGLIFILVALLYNEFLLGLIDSTISVGTIAKIRYVQAKFLSIGLALIVLADSVIRRISWLESFTRKDMVTKILLATLPIFTLMYILEVSLKPFASTPQMPTTIFVRDSELGWKLKPNSEDVWGGVRVTINGKGLRGPELDYTKQSSAKRILYLGDSVTFGYKLDSYKQTFPYLIESALEDELGYEIETINGGVGGYSPWQEFIFLSTEGIKYDPDLIVVSFVLNDVGEKLGLVRFRGRGYGAQLENAVSGELDKFFKTSSILYFSRMISARMRFGNNIQQGAQEQESLDVKDLVYEPDRPDVQGAWEITLENLGKIFSYAKARDIPIVLVVFPFTFQFENVNSLSIPQKIVSEHAYDNEVPVVDLLPLLFMKMEEDGTKPEDLFLDADHLSPIGSEIVAEILADFIQQQRLITGEQQK